MTGAVAWTQPVKGRGVNELGTSLSAPKGSAVDQLIFATRGIALHGDQISIAQCAAISRALSAFDLDAYQGPYGALLHMADIAVSRPNLTHSILALNAVRNLFIRLLEELK